MRHELHEAVNDDPTKYPISEGSIDVLEQGNKEIDHIYEKIFKHLEQSKIDMKQRLKEAYIANYKSTLDKKSQSFLNNLDKLENYVNECLRDFERRFSKGKFPLICVQRPKVDELNTRMDRFKQVFNKMVEDSREFREEY